MSNKTFKVTHDVDLMGFPAPEIEIKRLGPNLFKVVDRVLLDLTAFARFTSDGVLYTTGMTRDTGKLDPSDPLLRWVKTHPRSPTYDAMRDFLAEEVLLRSSVQEDPSTDGPKDP